MSSFRAKLATSVIYCAYIAHFVMYDVVCFFYINFVRGCFLYSKKSLKIV